MLAVAGCQSGDSGTVLDVNAGGNKDLPPPSKVLESELRAYCPAVTLREGTAFFNSYEKNGKDDPSKIIYQASIADVTRSCAYSGDMTTMTVAVAGKIVPGPVGKVGDITMPIRVVVTRGDEVLYTKLHQYKVAVDGSGNATQFVFSDPNVTFQTPPERSIQVFAGYDEGPPAKKK